MSLSQTKQQASLYEPAPNPILHNPRTKEGVRYSLDTQIRRVRDDKIDPNAQNSERGIYCMTKVKNPPPSGFSVLLARASRWSSTLVWKQFFLSQIFLFKGILHQKNFYRLNLIFWIVMGCGIARFGRKGLKTTET